MRALFLFLALAGALAAQASRPTPPAKPASIRKTTVSDAELERDIRERFSRSKISVEKFQVRVQSGVAIIEGKTDVVQRKATATRLARLAGAREVRNKIEVGEKARQKAAANLAEGRRRAQVKRGEQRTSLNH
ncbi:MAG: BON domain-containing protein [Acidimicrobiia bacterium]|nr:BON domain-containing protein [Acidimicrobiia bacterium]